MHSHDDFYDIIILHRPLKLNIMGSLIGGIIGSLMGPIGAFAGSIVGANL